MRHRAVVSTILALAIVLLAAPGLLQAQEVTPQAAAASILLEYGEAWSSGDAAQVAALYTEDAVREDIPTGATSRGRRARSSTRCACIFRSAISFTCGT